MPKKLLVGFFSILFFCLLLTPTSFSQSLDTSSGNLDNITKQLAELNDSLNKSVAPTKPLQTELDKMKKQFIDGAAKHGHKAEILEKIWVDWEAFATQTGINSIRSFGAIMIPAACMPVFRTEPSSLSASCSTWLSSPDPL